MLLTRSAGASLSQQVYSILQKYGTDAHVYLPGIGVINGLTAGNYLDSAGTTAATVDNPVGLVLDAANSQLGSELVTNGTFDTDTNWTKGTGWAIADGKATHSAGTAAYLSQPTTLTTGRMFLFSFTISGRTAGLAGARLENAFNSVVSANGSYTEYIVTTSNNPRIIISADSAFNGSVDNVSVKEVTGIHALQATTANKPILRKGAVNLLTYSEDYTNVSWSKLNTSIPTAGRIQETAVSGFHAINKANLTPVGLTATISVEAKAGERNYIRLSDGVTHTAVYNLSTGIASSVAGTPTDIRMTSIGDGWYRCSFTFVSASATSGWYLYLLQDATTLNYLGDITKGISARKAQLNTGTLADYIPTTTAAASSATGNYHWVHDSTDVLTATFPAGYESATTINASTAGQSTLTAQNIVGAYNIGPSIDTYGRFIFKTIDASELAIIQSFANRLAGV